MADTIFQHFIVQDFILPFLLIFTLVFAILEKTKLLGDGKKQLNAIVAFVIGLIFVTAVFPKEVVGNLMLFLTVALVIMFVIMLLWGFVFGDIKDGFKPEGWMKIGLGLIIGIATIAAVIWAVGIRGGIIDFLFRQSWSSTFWTNFSFVIIVVLVLVYFIRKPKG
ncbi:hypothetical protein KAJ87_02465 [Candidatus Pacearchaeota archaeon]|nr:hypothetical protein [Candidatus Pacearchaeota archaeon]